LLDGFGQELVDFTLSFGGYGVINQISYQQNADEYHCGRDEQIDFNEGW
jgi:hypothetical protein